MKTTIYIPDMECESCAKLISKKFKNEKGIDSFTFDEEKATVEHDEGVTSKHIISMIESAGFRAGTEPYDRKTFSERWRDFNENPQKYKYEKKAIANFFYIFLALTALSLIAYFGIFRSIPYFLNKYGLYLLYTNITIAAIGAGYAHFMSFRAKVSCMVGMMIGMTFGMQTGMMLGTIIGATNGFFIGALVAMILSVALGVLSGKSCGIMGSMQGMMAGVMGGTMGPMISVMMFTDNLGIFLPPYMIINLLIILALVYMLYEELGENRKEPRIEVDLTTLISICVIVAVFLVALMVYGPKSAAIA